MDAPTYFFEDAQTGDTFRAGPFVVTRESIIAFAQAYDPQPFHLDEEVAKASLLGGLAASGWQTTAIGMRLFYEALVKNAASMGSPGFDEVRWMRPVRPGDALDLVVTIGETRPSASKPDRGFVTMHLDLRNGAGETVMLQRGPVIVQRRDTDQAATPGPSVTPISAVPAPPPPADPMLTAFYEDIEIGRESALGTQLFTRDAIVDFAKTYDPQYFHVDAEAATASHFGGLVASGWQTAAYWMKHYVATRARSAEARRAAGLPVAVAGPSPGFTKIRWLRPVRVGETLTYAQKIIGKYPTGRAGWGLGIASNTGHGADGHLAFAFEGRILWPMRGA